MPAGSSLFLEKGRKYQLMQVGRRVGCVLTVAEYGEQQILFVEA